MSRICGNIRACFVWRKVRRMNIISSTVIGVMVMVIVVVMAVTRGVVNVDSCARMLRRFWK